MKHTTFFQYNNILLIFNNCFNLFAFADYCLLIKTKSTTKLVLLALSYVRVNVIIVFCAKFENNELVTLITHTLFYDAIEDLYFLGNSCGAKLVSNIPLCSGFRTFL